MKKFLPIVPPFQPLSFLYSSAISFALVGPENMQYEAGLLILFIIYFIPSGMMNKHEVLIPFLIIKKTIPRSCTNRSKTIVLVVLIIVNS